MSTRVSLPGRLGPHCCVRSPPPLPIPSRQTGGWLTQVFRVHTAEHRIEKEAAGRVYVLQPGKTIAGLLKAGVLCKIDRSNYNTPILPVEKKNTGKFRMVHDLRAINSKVLIPALPVPNPHSALSQISPLHTHFTCIDLANAFFCIPLDASMQKYFAFTWNNECYSYTRLPQGFVLSPGVFNASLKQLLSPLQLPNDVLLVQYVDDLLLAAPSEKSCLQATQLLLSHLAKVGLKCTKDKLQIARPQVAFLGRLISKHGTGISPSHKDDILHHPKPTNVKQMLSFWGLCNYSRHHVPDFAELTHSLRQLVNEKGMRNMSHVLDWTQNAETSFVLLKQFLSSAAALVVPDYTRMFYLDVSEKSSSVSAVLFQKTVDGNRRVCLYASTPLEKYEQRHHVCAAFSSALARLIQKTSHIVLHHQLTVRTSHSTIQYVTSQAFTMTGGRQRKIESVLTQPHILFIHEGRNMADGLLEGQLHCCTQQTLQDNSLRDDFYDIPLDNPDLTLFTDGCCFKGENRLQSGIAVTQMTGSTFELKVAKRLTGPQSAQRAEIIAMTSALTLAKDKTVNIYTDSAYVHVVLHTAITEWLRNDFMTASGTPIKHKRDIFELMDALLLPKKVAVIKCKGHSKKDDFVSVGNDFADRAAKYVAGYSPELQLVVSEGELGSRQEITPETIKQWQLTASPEEKSVWLAKGVKQNDAGIWLREDETLRRLQNWSHPYMKQIVKSELQDCSVCNKFNCLPTTKPPPGTHDPEVTAPALPVALMNVRMSLNSAKGWTPFEGHKNRPFPAPNVSLGESHVTRPPVIKEIVVRSIQGERTYILCGAPVSERGYLVSSLVYQAGWLWLNAATKGNHLLIYAHTTAQGRGGGH
ncbi:uncharacterized protein LOC144040639 [Vanacampus margaritifer]